MPSGWLGLDWGNVPSWVGSTLTSVSIFVAARAYARNVHDKEVTQASKISAWTEVFDEDGIEQRSLYVVNRSEDPVYEVTVLPFDAGVIQVGDMRPGAEEIRLLPAVPASRLRKTFGLSLAAWWTRAEFNAVRHLHEPLPELAFRDSGERWWRRDGRGALRRSKPTEEMTPSIAMYFLRYKIAVLNVSQETGKWVYRSPLHDAIKRTLVARRVRDLAESLADDLLADCPGEAKHAHAVLERAERASVMFPPQEAAILLAASILHGIGRAPRLVETGFPPLDAARYLSDHNFPTRLCELVAHQAFAHREAEIRGLSAQLSEWSDEQTPLRDALWWAIMTTTPDGQVTTVDERLAAWQDDLGTAFTFFTTQVRPELISAVQRTEERLRATES